MKELIYSVSTTLYIIIVIFIIYIMNITKVRTSRYYKITRNLFVVACISALIACFSLKSLSLDVLIYPILAVPIWLFNIVLYHKNMIRTKKVEKTEKEFLKTQPIDVEYKN